MTVPFSTISSHLDGILDIPATPDYPTAVNGVQVSHRGPVAGIATAVDASLATIQGAAAAGANLLIVHHGLFWSGVPQLTAHRYDRIRALFDHDMALYSAHLPLDAHARFGNSRLLAEHLSLVPTAPFARFQNVACGVQGTSDLSTSALLGQLDAFAKQHGGNAVASAFHPERRTRRWAICSGAGAGAATFDEAAADGVDTLIVGEGPHWTAVDAPERGLLVIYAGHYATETLGVRALGEHLASKFGLSHTFVPMPTRL